MNTFRKMKGIRKHVLVVEDELINRLMLGNILIHAEGEPYEVHYAENGKEALEALDRSDVSYSLILLDLMMPVMDGFSFLEAAKADERLKGIPVIVMTSEADAELRSIRNGAADFIRKPFDFPEVILARIERIIELSEDKGIIKSAERDALTGLYSKDFFYEYVRRIDGGETDRTADVLVLNIEHFRLINELYGRKEGDVVLQKVAGTIESFLSKVTGIACRAEGDTFFIYCDHQEDYGDLLRGIHEDMAQLSHSPKVRLRVGIYQLVDKGCIVETWFDRAKLASDMMRGDYTQMAGYYNQALHEKSIYHERLINDIDDAIKNRDLMVYYQPKYNIQGERPVLNSAEALIRWNHPQLGLISPGEFIPLFESNGLIQKLDNYVWREAGDQMRRWREEYGITIPVSVNVSRIDIYDPNLENKILQVLSDNELNPEDFMLEITESAYAENMDRLNAVINNIRALGFRIELDDFGSGYSSLNMLTMIQIDVLKMDMKFVRNMFKDSRAYRLVELVMDIAHFLGVPVVAEGVEEEDQLEALKKLDCEVIQGYYFSKPVPPEQFGVFIEKEKLLRSMEESSKKEG